MNVDLFSAFVSPRGSCEGFAVFTGPACTDNGVAPGRLRWRKGRSRCRHFESAYDARGGCSSFWLSVFVSLRPIRRLALAAATQNQSAPAPAAGNKSTAAKAKKNPTSSASLPATKSDVPLRGSTATLAPVIVTAATRNAQPVDTTATSTTVLTNDFLQDQNYSRAADALQSVPGLAVVTSGTPGQATSVFSRGQTATRRCSPSMADVRRPTSATSTISRT